MARDLDLSHLRSFAAVAETGSMTRAAAARNLTQSAISQQIRALEANLGCRLFDRSRTAVTLTHDGLRLLGHAQRMINLNDELLAAMTDAGHGGSLRLGVPHDVIAAMLPQALKRFHAAFPDVFVTLVSDDTPTLAAMMDDGALDMTITTDLERKPSARLLFRDELVWVGADGGNCARRRPLPVAIGPGDTEFSRAVVSALDTAAIAWRPVTQVGSLEPVVATLLADMAVGAFLSRTLPAGTAVAKDLPGLPPFHVHLRARFARPSTIEAALIEAVSTALTP